VGSGPFPSELTKGTGETLRRRGAEFGVVTGRPRRCGWLDLAALRYAVAVNGFTHLAVTKLDVLDSFEEIGVCTGYRGAEDTSLPLAIACEPTPIIKRVRGWRADTTQARSWDDLPDLARSYISFVESEAGVPVSYVSVGPERSQIIVRAGAPLGQPVAAS
jgi:adenylosuccinate synthase